MSIISGEAQYLARGEGVTPNEAPLSYHNPPAGAEEPDPQPNFPAELSHLFSVLPVYNLIIHSRSSK